MKKHASNVEDINIHHIKQRLSMSCIAYLEEWSNIFRNRTFTLCKNDWMVDSVTVSVSISSSMTNLSFFLGELLSTYGSPRSCSQHFTRFPLLRRPLVVSVPFWVVWWAGTHQKSPCSWLLSIQRAQKYLKFRFGCHRETDAVEASTSRVLSLHHETKFIIGFNFAETLSSPASSCVLFRHRFKTFDGTEMADVEQTQKMIPFITCEISLCQCVCELVLGVNVIDLDLGVQIDSIKQPIKSNAVVSGNMSHCKASSLYGHLDHCFVVFKHIQQSLLTIRMHVWRKRSNIVQIINQMFLSHWQFVRVCTN